MQFVCIAADIPETHTVSIGTVPCKFETQRLKIFNAIIWDSDSAVAEGWRSLGSDAVFWLVNFLPSGRASHPRDTNLDILNLSREVCSYLSLYVSYFYSVGIYATPWTFYKMFICWKCVGIFCPSTAAVAFCFFVGLLCSSVRRWTVPVYLTV